ncbi:Cation/H+ exchanger [Corchorus olitorius]|uniref:Cation/H+ exchanger n=1 Tax=Corchorus olitorius TaxID=93759 RepID=A0A1R3K5X1_9ROSI|nr:Cation/H+ exchanger [Corchorus olitorius]
MGFMLFLFISGVKMDLGLLKKSGKKHFYIGFVSVFMPLIVVTIVALVTRKSMDKELGLPSSIGGIASSLAVTAFPIHYCVLQELNLLSSEVGNMALSIALVSDALGMNFVVIFEAMKQGEVGSRDAILYMVSLIVLGAFMMTAVHRVMIWIIEKTPEGEPVDQFYVVGILLAVFVMGFLTDMFGIAIANGPFWLGLLIPNGPPLGKTLVERSETIIMEVIMPFSFAFIGLSTDFSAMFEAGWSTLGPLFAMVIAGYLSKFLSVLFASYTASLPLKDCLALSLVLSLRGQVELLLYVHWVDKNMIKLPAFTMLIFLTLVSTGSLSPLISIFYDPSKPYMVNKRRTIQHTAPQTELRILLCIQDKESVPSLINLLEVSYPTVRSPFDVSAFHIVELVGRANPLFIDHENSELEDLSKRFQDSETIQNALKQYQERRDECVKLHLFTASTAKRTMYQDVCKLALVSKAAIIILPFHKEKVGDINTVTEHWGAGQHYLNIHVLTNAPCSVGVLIDKSNRYHLPVSRSFRGTGENFIVLFLGGADAREALAYADRMVGNPNVSLTVIRFLSSNSEGDDEREKKLDDGVVTWFWVKNETNNRVIYREVVVRNGAETVAAIQAMTEENYYHLWIMGRKQGINPRLLEGMSTWTENKEQLGIIGDYVSSADFPAADSVLVVQQQILRGQGSAISTPSRSSLRRWLNNKL